MRLETTTPRRMLSRMSPILLLLPSLTLIGLLMIVPVGYAIWKSLFIEHGILAIKRFVGLKNYINLLKDPEYWSSLKITLIYTVSTIMAQFTLGLGTALLLNMPLKGRALFRGIILLPYVMLTVVSVFLWRWILNDSYGILNYVLLSLHIIREPIWWLGKNHVMGSLILVSTWKFFPFAVISFLGALQEIDPILYEAAIVDGASALQRFFHITLPHMRNIILVVLLLRGMWMFTKFDIVWLMAGKSSTGRYVQTLPIYAYIAAFGRHQVGMGCTISVISFTILIVFVSVALSRMYEKEAVL